MAGTTHTSEQHLPEYDQAKLEAVILYFLQRANNSHLGKTKLMKLLYYADFDHMERYGSPITGAQYVKMPQGPVPEEAASVIDSMVAEGKIKSSKEELGPYPQYRYEATADPDLSLLTIEEITTLEQVTARWSRESRGQIVAASHSESPWLSVRMGAPIPYSLARFRSSLSTRLH